MNTVKFTIHGEPKSKLRPRIASRGKHASMYQPQQNIMYENLVKVSYLESIKDSTPKEFMDSKTALNVSINAFFSIPKSTSKKKRLEMIHGELLPIKKPDVDNLAKTILDSLNGIAYHDDAQVVFCCITKQYSENPRIEVIINDFTKVGLMPFE